MKKKKMNQKAVFYTVVLKAVCLKILTEEEFGSKNFK